MADPAALKTNLLQREDIKTMRKDLTRLREADVASESRRIIRAKTEETGNQPLSALSPRPSQVPSGTNLKEEKAAPKKPDKPDGFPPEELSKSLPVKPAEKDAFPTKEQFNKAKKYANEVEKQKMHLLELKRGELGKKLQDIHKEKEPLVNLQKNKKLSEQENLREKLVSLSQKPGKKTWFRKPPEEKEKWVIEKRIKDLNRDIEAIKQEERKLLAETEKIEAEISSVNNSLNSIYGNIKSREKEVSEHKEGFQQALAGEPFDEPAAEKIIKQPNKPPDTSEAEPDFSKPAEPKKAAPAAFKEKTAGPETFRQKTPAMPQKEALKKSFQGEREQRKRFLEEVEEWVKSTQK